MNKMKRILITLLVLSGTEIIGMPKLTFRDSYLRYAASHDLIRLFLQKFPYGSLESVPDCASLTDKQRATLGDPNPMNGEMTYRAPSASYAQLITQCLLDGIERDFEKTSTNPGGISRLLGKEVMDLLEKQGQGSVVTAPKGTLWSALSEELRRKMTVYLVHYYIGPNVIPDEGPLVEALLRTPIPNANVLDTLKRIALFVTMQDEFLIF